MPDIADILDDEIKEDDKKPSKFLFLSIRAWERICLAVMMIIGGLILERASTISTRLDTLESKIGTDQKQWERITKISDDVRDNRILSTKAFGHHKSMDKDMDSMWIALKSVDNEAAKIAIQAGVNKELLRLIIEEDILSNECNACRQEKEEKDDEVLKPIIQRLPPPEVKILNEFNNRLEQIPEELDHYKMRQMQRER